MNFPLYIARRYLLAKKKQNAINIISGISVLGITTGTMALVIVLSVFNGFDAVVKSLFNAFDPEIRISATEGKTFVPDPAVTRSLLELPGVDALSEVLEENVYLVEFSGDDGRTFALEPLPGAALLTIHYKPISG